MTPVPKPAPPVDERCLLTSLTFFLTPAQRSIVLRALRSMQERDRTAALLRLVREHQSQGARS